MKRHSTFALCAGVLATGSMFLGLHALAHRFDPVCKHAKSGSLFETAADLPPYPSPIGTGGGNDQRARVEHPEVLLVEV